MRGDASGSGGGAAYRVNGGRTKPLGIKGAGRMPSAVLLTRLVLPEHVAHRPADVAHRGPVAQRVVDEGHQVVLAGGGPEYERIFTRVRNVGYVALALVAIAAYMMVTKLGS